MVRTNRFRRAAFVSLEHYTDARGVLIKLGQQLLPERDKFHVGLNDDLDRARQPIDRALSDHPTIIVIDNVESVLAGYGTGSVSDLPTQTTSNAEAQVADAPRTASEADAIFTRWRRRRGHASRRRSAWARGATPCSNRSDKPLRGCWSRADCRKRTPPPNSFLQRALAAGEAAYAEAVYDIAMAYILWGRVLKIIGAAEAALPPLREAQRRSQALVDAGNTRAEHTVSVAIAEAAECLIYLGRYDEAVAAYEENIQRAEKLGDRRQVAVGKGNLGAVRCRKNATARRWKVTR